jgi:zinc protease
VTSLARAIAALIVIATVARADVPADKLANERFPTEQFELDSGLFVILAPDPTASSVVVHVRYESGSASELPGEPGFTHVVEQLLGMGSVHVKDFDAQIDAIGGWTTARAAVDHVGTTTHAPPHALERVLWLEAERMAGLADAITEPSLARARDATLAAWRAAYVDAPYALVERELGAAMWTGKLAGYGRPVLGDGRAVATASLVQLRAFVRRRLVPNNAVLVIAGNLDAKATRRLVARYFGWMPEREHVLHAEHWIPQPAKAERTVKNASPAVVVGYHCNANSAAVAIAAHVLGDREGRLHQRVVARGLASDVRAELVRYKVGWGELRIHATPLPGIDPKRVAAAVRSEVAALEVTEPEVERAITVLETELHLAAENLTVRAELLAATSWARTSGPSYFVWWPERLRKTRARDVRFTIHADEPVTIIGREDAP